MNVNLHNPSHSTVRLTLSDVSFVYEAWQHMAILNAEVVMRPKHIGGDHGGIATAVLLKVGPTKTHTGFIQTAHVFQRQTIFFFFKYSTCYGHQSFSLHRHSHSWTHEVGHCGPRVNVGVGRYLKTSTDQ